MARPQGGFELGASASQVTVEVISSGNKVVHTETLGARAAGRQSFDFKADGLEATGNYRFKVSANSGKTPLDVTPMYDRPGARRQQQRVAA